MKSGVLSLATPAYNKELRDTQLGMWVHPNLKC